MVENMRVGPFQILDRLGTNRRHKVFHARQTEQNREVALKFIKPPPDIDRPTALARIQREMEMLKTLVHPHIVRVFGAGVSDDQVFIAHELIPGESLTTRLSRLGKLAPDLVVDLATQIADALAYLHERDIYHAKLTPDKILIDNEGRAYVNDIRLNRAKRRSWDATHRRELDAAAYLAPEQFNEGATHKSDLYALGAILYEMLTGRLPLEPDTLANVYHQKTTQRPPSVSSLALDCPIWLDRLIAALLDPDPAQRPHSARAVYYALLEIRKIDKNKTAVVNQMTRGFNPLTIGADKTEAKRLLGQLDVARDRQPIYQRTWVQVVALIGVLTAITYLVWPPGNESLFRRGMQLMASNEVDDVEAARNTFDRIIQRRWNDTWTTEAELKVEEARGKILLLNAKEGNLVGSPRAVEFMRAYRDELAGDTNSALKKYHQLIDDIGDKKELQYIKNLSRGRIVAIGEAANAERVAEKTSADEEQPAVDSSAPDSSVQ